MSDCTIAPVKTTYPIMIFSRILLTLITMVSTMCLVTAQLQTQDLAG